MKNKLCFFVCQNYEAEIKEVLHSYMFEDTEYAVFPSDCGAPPLHPDEIEKIEVTLTSECDKIWILGSQCVRSAKKSLEQIKTVSFKTNDNCLYSFTNKAIVDGLIQEGSYLTTPGCLSRWRFQIEKWGFDRETAQKFFAEFANQLVLLDTCVDPNAADNLRDMANFLKLPHRILMIGTDFFRLALTNIVQTWRLKKEIKKSATVLSVSNKKLADYEMMYSLLNRISAIKAEEDVIRGIIELFMLLCAPSQMLYLPVIGGEAGKMQFSGSDSADPKQEIRKMMNLQADYSWTDTQNGFYLGISYLDRTVGILKVENFAFPEHKQHYLNIAHTIGKVSGLAIANSRKYRKLEIAREDIKKAKEAADVANSAKSEFLANMSHELRTPLNGVLGYAQILKRDEGLTESQQVGLDIIERSGKHLLNLINEVLDLSKIEARKMEINASGFRLPGFLNDIVRIIQIQARQKNISFHSGIAPDLPSAVLADEKRLGQILLNLMSNAVKFTQEGGVIFTVTRCQVSVVSHHSSGADNGRESPENGTADDTPLTTVKIRFQVEDTGVGISEDQLKDIFSPFKQVGDHSRSIEGTGLGLTISRKLVRLMGGDIYVKSTAGKGSVFRFDLELPETSEWADSKPSDKLHIVGYKGKMRKILVTDDRWENRAVLTKLLSSLGFEILEATDGHEGVCKALESEPDLILMDLVMPGTDGFEATRQIRNSPTLKHIKVIAVSASTLRSPQEIISENGFDDFIAKPVQLHEIFEKLETHLGLEWEYKDSEASGMPDEERKEDESLLPPLSEITTLYDFARGGDIMKIRKQLDVIEQSDKRYAPFTEEIRKLARSFQVRQIRNILGKHVGDEK